MMISKICLSSVLNGIDSELMEQPPSNSIHLSLVDEYLFLKGVIRVTTFVATDPACGSTERLAPRLPVFPDGQTLPPCPGRHESSAFCRKSLSQSDRRFWAPDRLAMQDWPGRALDGVFAKPSPVPKDP